MSPRVGQALQDVVIDIGEEVRERAEGEGLFGAGRATGQDGHARVPRYAEGGTPDGRLADASLTIEDKRRELARGALDEPIDGDELDPPADDRVRHDPLAFQSIPDWADPSATVVDGRPGSSAKEVHQTSETGRFVAAHSQYHRCHVGDAGPCAVLHRMGHA